MQIATYDQLKGKCSPTNQFVGIDGLSGDENPKSKDPDRWEKKKVSREVQSRVAFENHNI